MELTNESGRETDRDEKQKNLRAAQFPRQQHTEGVVMVVITEGAKREAGNEVPIWWSLLRPPLLPAQDAAPNQKKMTLSDLQL